MKIVFFSTFISPHIRPFCDYLYDKCDFTYVQTSQLSEERINMGYKITEQIPYLLDLSFDKRKQKQLAEEADCVIINSGSCEPQIVYNRIKNNKLTFFCNERLFKKGLVKILDPRLWKQIRLNFLAKGKNTYLLCLGSYVSKDFEMTGFEKGKSFKFGYFPVNCGVMQHKKTEYIHIVWIGRMIDWKQPQLAITVAQRLFEQNVLFTLDMIGDGPLRNSCEKMGHKLINLGIVKFHKMLSNTEVQKILGMSDILLMTSNRQEGWGAVANEALGLGTPVIAFRCIGAANYILMDNINSVLCGENNVDDIIKAIVTINHDWIKYSKAAFKSVKLWNANVAANRFLEVVKQIEKGLPTNECFFETGPLSEA